ncbi:MAG TPA: phenylacetate-CoA oxygenase subunit PaaJ [Bacillus bacterium]|uniref:Phenylacetate-CoA oxygenase subunit PaaJ n=1 Tax=Siminovitchia fordii TaxID=254759 RepID=A0ABQ4K7I4_9BACI|nr:1,2-phenylacetyl-CoA epoxidase subunit PaaD [Siminovitchia fordii]GIN21135.1 phenylacetate-CoA oxygenase subunit PaaJ [Siminovitchia fordii]HBZ09516.1 phenylacetate-CoA oxygenase subunit PaaJ [Bacillus sp. (in: firmicutes)]
MMTAMPISQKVILEILDTVKDPEIDTVSVIDLGMIENIHIDGRKVTVDILPTFLGCPALEIIERNIVRAIETSTPVESAKVRFVYHPPWTSDRITQKGHDGLREFGIAPPPRHMEEDGTWHVDCPYCDSTYVTMENIFGPTACRSILYCKSCKNPFEAMKPISNI